MNSIDDDRSPGVWRCPWCFNHETYELAAKADPRLDDVFEDAVSMVRQVFGVPDDDIPSYVITGAKAPEAVRETDPPAFHIFASRGLTDVGAAFELSHEAVHRVCTHNNDATWVDEMLATLTSIRFMEVRGMTAEADAYAAEFLREAGPRPAEIALLDGSVWRPGNDYYAKCYALGDRLLRATSWEEMGAFPSFRTNAGAIDADAWLTSLDRPSRRRAQKVLLRSKAARARRSAADAA